MSPGNRPKNTALAAAIAGSGHTQIEIAREAGITTATLSRVLCKYHLPQPRTARAIAAALNTTPALLFAEAW